MKGQNKLKIITNKSSMILIKKIFYKIIKFKNIKNKLNNMKKI